MASTTPAHYRSLLDQISDGVYDKALKRVTKLLKENTESTDPLPKVTQVKLLLALDRYSEALPLSANFPLERAYCLYKLGRTDEADLILQNVENDERAWTVLKAQVAHKQHDYSKATALFEDLLLTADEPDSPEYLDLQSNLGVTSLLSGKVQAAELALSQRHSEFTDLESVPLGPLVRSSARKAQKTTPEQKKTKPENGLDPDRWLPKKQRASYLAEIAKNSHNKRRKTKMAASALLTQGADIDSETLSSGVSTPTGASQKGGKKKKGKK